MESADSECYRKSRTKSREAIQCSMIAPEKVLKLSKTNTAVSAVRSIIWCERSTKQSARRHKFRECADKKGRSCDARRLFEPYKLVITRLGTSENAISYFKSCIRLADWQKKESNQLDPLHAKEASWSCETIDGNVKRQWYLEIVQKGAMMGFESNENCGRYHIIVRVRYFSLNQILCAEV